MALIAGSGVPLIGLALANRIGHMKELAVNVYVAIWPCLCLSWRQIARFEGDLLLEKRIQGDLEWQAQIASDLRFAICPAKITSSLCCFAC